jgi:iron complex outermembrane receptor protein
MSMAAVFAALALATPASAQQDEEESDTSDDSGEPIEEVVVTGSRLKRDTYSSISPLQVITGQVSREVGLIDAGDILQESTAASGQQIDLTFQGFVLDNGPGTSTINLRGLGEARTLVLINGRRMAPGGVEGAPFAPDLNQVPASLVQQYDLLLDGASSVYGSDAVAGVANIILRKDFDGFEIEGYTQVPHHSNGTIDTLNASWGRNFDRGFIGFGVEYVQEDATKLRDRPWTAGCETNYEITESGEIRTAEEFYRSVYNMEWDECRLGLLAGRVNVPFAGSIYYTPGVSNGGWPEFSESSDPFAGNFGVDTDQDGVADLTFRDYDLNGTADALNQDLFPENSTTSFMGFGEYTFEGDMNITPYFEVLYTEREFFADSGEPQLFPNVPALNPFNICNPNGDGVDCGLGWDGLMNNPGFVTDILANFGCDPSTGGSCDQTQGAIGPAGVIPIVSVQGDRSTTEVEGKQYRVVGGVRGDLPFIDFGPVDNWTFDVYYSFSASDSSSKRLGVRQDRLDVALGIYSLTNTPCEINDPNAVGPRSGLTAADLADDVAPGCVPVNLFAPSLYPVNDPTTIVGDFATQAERDYVFDGRDFDTEYEQTVISAYLTGDILSLPAGEVAFGFGYEFRNDDINSIPDQVARDGLLFGFFVDGGAIGERDTNELFAEVEIPLLANLPAAEELTINASTRLTDDEIYGENWTGSYKLGWRPVDSLLLRGTYGTAFRAPNLRELYLQSQTGFGNIFDPCFIPEAALDPLTGDYIPERDTREPEILSNCLANGVDPTLASNDGFNTFSTEISSGGALDLNPEKSDSWSAGFSWDQPFTNAFGLSISATYYEIQVRQTIIEPSAQFIVNDCYGSLQGDSVFCDRIARDLSDPTSPVIDLIDSGFINREREDARGVDINVAFDDTFTVFQRPIDFSMDIVANRTLERSTLFVDVNGNPDKENFEGEWGFPDWRVQAFLRFDYDDFRFTWESRYISSVEQDPDGIDDFGDIFGSTGIIGDTCFGPPDDELCRDYADAENYFLHNLSVFYFGDRWTLGAGVRNVFDEEPPIVDGTEILSINNAPLGYGYDLRGRTYFFNAQVNFGGGQ